MKYCIIPIVPSFVRTVAKTTYATNERIPLNDPVFAGDLERLIDACDRVVEATYRLVGALDALKPADTSAIVTRLDAIVAMLTNGLDALEKVANEGVRVRFR